MADSNAVVIQELKNTQNQLVEMQATMMLWMESQSKQIVEQEKKTLPLLPNSGSLPYGLRRWK